MQTTVKLFQVMQQIQKQHYLSEITISIFLYEKHENMIVYMQAATFYEQIYRFHLSATNSNQPSHFRNSTDINKYHIPLYNYPKPSFSQIYRKGLINLLLFFSPAFHENTSSLSNPFADDFKFVRT